MVVYMGIVVLMASITCSMAFCVSPASVLIGLEVTRRIATI